jgi:YD repeat-containing protein
MYIFQDELKGKIKTHTTFLNGVLEERMHFDEVRKLTRRENYKEGKLQELFTIEPSGNIFVSKTFNYSAGKQSPSVKISLTTNDDKLLEESYFDETNTLLWRQTNSFDDNGNMIAEKGEGDINVQAVHCRYDSNNNLTEKRIESKVDTECLHYFFEYDAHNDLIKKIKQDGNGKTIKTQVSEFENGNQTVWKKFDSNGLLVKLKLYQYNEVGKMTRKIKFEKYDIAHYQSVHDTTHFTDDYNWMQLFTVDVNGNTVNLPTSIQYLDSDTRYEYDGFGNEVLKEMFEYRDDFSNQRLTVWRADYHTYNEQNMLVSNRYDETHTDWDWSGGTDYQYQFDETGRLLLKETGSNTKTHYSYNGQGTLVKELELVQDEKSDHRKEIIYDDTGNVTRYNDSRHYIDEGIVRSELKIFEIEYYV